MFDSMVTIIISVDVVIIRTGSGQSRQACGAMALAKEVWQGPRASGSWGLGVRINPKP